MVSSTSIFHLNICNEFKLDEKLHLVITMKQKEMEVKINTANYPSGNRFQTWVCNNNIADAN